jgi:hypothetical protein
MTTPEGKVKAEVRKQLRPLARLWEFMPVQNGMGKPALDFLLCVNGRFIAIETKAKGKKLTTRQEHTKAEMEAAGAKVFVVDDVESLRVAIKYIAAASVNEDDKVDNHLDNLLDIPS